ncbi:MAG TPA: hypothetical protein VL442_15665 [Mucilaginibacter sp.]|jgi:hypothetical protein|nr:hypothetical protein [Mucilaginibacter sp.]
MDNDPLNILDEAATQPANPPQQNDALANQERQKEFLENKRGESYKKHIHYIMLVFMYIVAVLFSIMVIIRVYDFVAPETPCWRWLSERQDHDLERIVFSGIILSFASKYFKKYNIVD